MICGFVMKYADILLTPYEIYMAQLYFLWLVHLIFCSSFALSLLYYLAFSFLLFFALTLDRFDIVAFSIATANVVQNSNHYCRNSFYALL